MTPEETWRETASRMADDRSILAVISAPAWAVEDRKICFTPDGKFFIYLTTEDGRFEVHPRRLEGDVAGVDYYRVAPNARTMLVLDLDAAKKLDAGWMIEALESYT